MGAQIFRVITSLTTKNKFFMKFYFISKLISKKEKLKKKMKKDNNYEDYYDFKTISSGVFGVTQSVKHIKSQDKLYTMKSVEINSFRSESMVRNEIKLLEKLSSLELKPKAIAPLVGIMKNKNKNEYNFAFDIYPKHFKEIMEDLKTKSDEIFPFFQLKSCFDSIVKTFAFLQTMKICHLEIKPSNIYYDSLVNQIYLLDFSSNSKDSILKVSNEVKKEFSITGSSLYFPPEIDAALNANNSSSNLNPYKADVFSFAIVFLEISTLQLPSKIYGVSQWKEGIDNLLKKLRDIYTKSLSNAEDKKQLELFLRIMKNCLSFNPDERPDFMDLFFTEMKLLSEDKIRLHILLDEEMLSLENIRSFENFRGKDFVLKGLVQHKVDVKISGKALNSTEKEFFTDEE